MSCWKWICINPRNAFNDHDKKETVYSKFYYIHVKNSLQKKMFHVSKRCYIWLHETLELVHYQLQDYREWAMLGTKWCGLPTMDGQTKAVGRCLLWRLQSQQSVASPLSYQSGCLARWCMRLKHLMSMPHMLQCIYYTSLVVAIATHLVSNVTFYGKYYNNRVLFPQSNNLWQ